MEQSPSSYELDSDFEFFDPVELENPWAMLEGSKEVPKEEKPNKLKPKEKVFLARLGAAALATAMLAVPVARHNVIKTSAAEKTIEKEADLPGTITFEPLIVINDLKPTVEVVDTSPAMSPVETIENVNTAETELTSTLESMLTAGFAFAPDPVAAIAPALEIAPTPEAAPVIENAKWEGKALNAYDGHINGPTGDETYYNLPMHEIVDRMHRMGVEGEYWVREDGVKMLGNYVMVAANLKTHPRGSIVETSLGTGIVCDTGSFAKDHPNRLDIATDW